MQRTLIVALTLAVVGATLSNPHFLSGGSYDVYDSTLAPAVGALVCLAAVGLAAALLWRGKAGLACGQLVLEQPLFLLLTAASVRMGGLGYFSNGWGGSFFSGFVLALVTRALLLALAYWRWTRPVTR